MKNAPVRHRLEYFAYRATSGPLRRLPLELGRSIGRGLGRLVHRLDPRRRRIALDNLTRALPELDPAERQRLARSSFESFGATIVDTLIAQRFDAVELCRRSHIEGAEHLIEVEDRGHPVIILSAHLGSWEAAAWNVGLSGRRLHVIGRLPDNPLLHREMVRMRELFGNRMISKHNAARGALRALRSGQPVAMLADQHVPPKSGIRLPFFGRPAITTGLPAFLSKRTGAAVLPGFGFLEPEGRYRLVLRPPILPPEGDDGTDVVVELTRRYLAAIEEEIRRRPGQWLWMHRRWRED